MNLLQLVATKLKCDPALVFFYAHHYCEVRKNKKKIAREYLRCEQLGHFPEFVSDWCLDFLNGAVQVPKGGKGYVSKEV